MGYDLQIVLAGESIENFLLDLAFIDGAVIGEETKAYGAFIVRQMQVFTAEEDIVGEQICMVEEAGP